MNCYIFITTSLLLGTWVCRLECWEMTRLKSLTDETPKPIAIVGTMGNEVKLPGHLESPTQPFYKDGKVLHAREHLYKLRKSPLGYEVFIRFLTCTDEGLYSLGIETFHLTARPQTTRGIFYYATKVDELTKAATITPLYGVVKISKLYVHPDNDLLWSLIEVWNHTMNRKLSLGHCCFITPNKTTFVGYGNGQCNYFVYQRQGQANDWCSNVQLAAFVAPRNMKTSRNPVLVKPSIGKLDDVKTTVKLHNVSEDLADIMEMIEEYKRSQRNSAVSSLQTQGLTIPIILNLIAMLMMVANKI